jgi:hypothetical protein
MRTFSVPFSLAYTTASGLKTIVQVEAATTRPVTILGFTLGGKGADPLHVPGTVELSTQTGTDAAGSSITPVPTGDDMSVDAIAATARLGDLTDTGVTSADPFYRNTCHPQTSIGWMWPADARPRVKGGSKIGIRANFAANVTLEGHMLCAE